MNDFIIYEIIFLLFIIICSCSIFAYYGGENYTEHFEDCLEMNLTINSTLPIDNGEYIIYSECSETIKNSYICKGIFIVGFKPNTINNYTFNFTCIKEPIIDSSGGGSVGNSKKRKDIILINNTQEWDFHFPEIQEKEVNHKPEIIIPEDNEEKIDTITQEKKDNYTWLVILMMFIFLCLGFAIIIKYGGKKNE